MKKFLSLVLALAMVLVCVACGDTTATNSNDADNTDKGTLFIGATGPLTGGAASYGISVKEGAQLAVEELNANGGINGMQVKFEIKDDEADAEKAQVGYNTLMDDGMQIALGSVTTDSCKAFAELANEDELFFITPSASAAEVVKNKYAFRVCFGDPDQGKLAAENLSANYTNIGAIYDNSDPYSLGVYTAFAEAMTTLNKTYTVKEFDKDTNRDFSTQVAELKDCDVIFLPIYYTEAALIAQEVKKIGSNAALFGCDGFDGIAASLEGQEIPNSIKYITPFDANSTEEVSAKFTAAYKAKYDGKTPDQFAADGYDAIMVLAQAIKAAGVENADIEIADLSAKVYEVMTSADFTFVGATGTMTWNAQGEPTKVPVIVDLAK